MAETLLQYKCPYCGGKLEFDSATQQMKCPYCDSMVDISTLETKDDVLDQEPASASAGGTWSAGETDGMRVYSCQSCGGEIVADETTGAASCPYCGNPVVMVGAFSGDLKPDLVLPFKLDKAAAKDALSRHLRGKKLLPKIFKSENHIDEVRGVYVPFWLFDADVDADLQYSATQMRSWSDSDYDYTETSYYNVWRAGSIGFDNVPVDGSEHMEDDLMESIEPFDVSQAVPFQTAYLSGYMAERYDVSEQQSLDRARQRMEKSTGDAFADTVTGYSSVSLSSASIEPHISRAKYALYPVWILNTSWRGKKYTFAMNGQSGKFVGDLPLDKGAYWRWFGILTGAVTAAALLVSYLFWLL